MPPAIKTNDDLKKICVDIARRVNSQAEFNEKLAELNIPRTAAIVFHYSWGQKMFMGMIYGLDGKTISF